MSGKQVPGSERYAFMSAERCARIGIGALLRGPRLIVPGFMSTLQMWWMRWLPRRLQAAVGALFMER